MRQLFIHDPTAKVTAQYLAYLLKPAFSPHSHNQREDDYLQDIEGIVCAQQLLDEMCRNCPHRCVFIHYTVYLPAGLEDAAALTPSMILSFVTGADKTIPNGISSTTIHQIYRRLAPNPPNCLYMLLSIVPPSGFD